MEEEKKPIVQRIDELEKQVNPVKTKKFRFPAKSKVKGARLRKNWIGVLKVNENGSGEFTKTQIEGSVFDFNKNNYHATDKSEMIMINGRYPLLIQPTWKINPLNVYNKGEVNETYGQPYLQAKMLKDVITKKDAAGGFKGFLIVGVILIVGYVIGKYVFKLF